MTRPRLAVCAVAAIAVVLVLVSGSALVAGAHSYSGVSCSVGASSITVSWQGETRAFQYTAWVRDSSGTESGQIVTWRSKRAQSASSTFTELALGSYTVWVIMQTVDGSWIKIGETTCTVAETATTTTTTTTTVASTTTTTTTEPPSNWGGSISCTTGPSSVTVRLDPAEGTDQWDIDIWHSTGYPRGGQLTGPDPFTGEFVHTFDDRAQGTWHVSAEAIFDDGTRRSAGSISCVVSSSAFSTTTTTTTTTPNSPATGAPTISGAAQVGQTLTADTSGIADADGLGEVTYFFQWLTDGGVLPLGISINGATGSSYTVDASDEGSRISVQVAFTDDVGHRELLLSQPTSTVVAASPPDDTEGGVGGL